MRRTVVTSCSFALLSAFAGIAAANPLNVAQVRNPADPAFPALASVVDFDGGIVTHKGPGGRGRLVIQNPAFPDGWGAIQVRHIDKNQSGNAQMYDHVNVGDWVSFTNLRVTDWVGNTMLEFDPAISSTFEVVSTSNPLPAVLSISPDDLAKPIEGEGGHWDVVDDRSEKYEGMRIQLGGGTITQVDVGRFIDNYEFGGKLWATDYNNANLPVGSDYLPGVEAGANVGGLSGYVEQSRATDGFWNYYQLVTMTDSDVQPPVSLPGDTNGDGAVELNDLNNVLNNFGATDPAVGDTDGDNDVDLDDLNAVRNNFGAVAASQAVPEPSAVGLGIVASAAIAGLFRGRPNTGNAS